MPRPFLFALAVILIAAASTWTVLCAQERKPSVVMAPTSLDGAFQLVQDAVENDNVPGAIALVAQQEKIVREEAFGLCDVENNRPMFG